MQQNLHAIRGAVLSYAADPFQYDIKSSMNYESDAIIIISDGTISQFGPYNTLLSTLPENLAITHYQDSIIMAGFIDCHVHYPQTQIIAAFSRQLIDWLDKYSFIAEQQFKNKQHAHEVAKIFLQECLRNGTTTTANFCTVFPESVDAFFEQSEKLNMRNIAGKLMMDRNAPDNLLDTPQQSYDESKALINKWHANGRQLYCVSPRFAPTSSAEQMDMAGQIWQEHPGTYLQSHISENINELAWVKQLFPQCSSYLDVYDQYGQLGPRAIYGHGIYLTEEELQRCHDTGTAIAHCPTSNLFLGSGLFNIANAMKAERPVRVGLATDLGAGTSFSMLQTMNEAYKVAQLNGCPLSSGQAFYLATGASARALYLDDKVGNIAPGMEADIVVLDLNSTPIIEYRMQYCDNIEEMLFVLMTMGDDRAVRATYIAGNLVYNKE